MMESITGMRALLDFQPVRPGDPRIKTGDTGKAERAFGFAASTSLAEGLGKQVAWQQSLRNDQWPSVYRAYSCYARPNLER